MVGRSEGDFLLARDHMLSKSHVQFDFDGHGVTVTDLGSSNSTFVEGKTILGPTSVFHNTFVQIGSSTLAVVRISAGDRAQLGAPAGGTYPFPRSFRGALAELPKEFRLPRGPHADGGAGSTWWRALLPLGSGIGFAVISGNAWFLLLSAFAPLVYAGDAYFKKRKRGRADASDQARFERESAEVREAFEATAVEERRRWRDTNQLGGTASLFAAVRHRRLWERRPADPDFLTITVGLATRPSAVVISEASAESNTTRTFPLWGSPVNVNLASTGALAVLGDRDRARAVVRGLLTGLAVTHAPNDVKLWLFAADNSAAEWGSVRWLPHAMGDAATCRIASTDTDRSAMVSTVRQIIAGRREIHRSSSDAIQLPVHLVIFDGADLLSPSDVSEILSLGPAVGVVGIVADPIRAPDGIMGTLRLGRAADEAVFESRLEPRIDGVLTAEMPSSWADTAARRLAALQPSSGSGAEFSVGSERLARMLKSTETTASDLAHRWATAGPTTRVPVGTIAESQFFVDIVKDGPHGLIGGMTRSGKTEFIKTLVTSLAWSNHPDDLNFVIVDFKGGVDYQDASRLPHVLDLSSNEDIAGFERTLQLLTAEQQRRQREFKSAGVSNLEGYRSARVQRGELRAIPRLLVLIDEFGELLSSDEGRDQLKRIESMSRIGGGLGINLLLITQNFEGQLPPQIAANAGLRLCFRVQEAANSKVVIGTGIATTIPATAKGRGFARLQGGDPIEFQSSRVAGRRPELKGNEAPVVARLQNFETLMHVYSDGDAVDVPASETDMFAMIDIVREASRQSGWVRPAVPWPKVLPTDLSLADVFVKRETDGVTIGLADVPESQQQRTFSLGDEHVALLGGQRADLNTLLVTIACSSAIDRSPDDLHLYAIDFTGRGLARVAHLPHCGGVASRNDALALRIGRFLLDEVSSRRSELALHGVATLDEYTQRTGRSFPHLMLLISGAEKLSSIASTDEQSPAAAPLMSLIAEGGGLGVQVIAAGLPAFALYRPGTYIDRRVLFEAADMSDYAGLGAPRSLVGGIAGPRRGVDVASRLAVQFCSLAAGAVNEADAFDAFVERLLERHDEPRTRPPRVITEVTWPVRLAAMSDHVRSIPSRMIHPILLGLDAQTGDPISVDAKDLGGPLIIAGGRKSGRSNAALVIGLLARHLGWDVVGVALSPTSPLLVSECPFDVVPIDELDLRIERASAPLMVILDDVHKLGDDDTGSPSMLSECQAVVATGPAHWFSGLQRSLTDLGVKRAVNGLILMPDSVSDVEAIGVKADSSAVGAAASRRPGQGFIGLSGEMSQIAVPLYES